MEHLVSDSQDQNEKHVENTKDSAANEDSEEPTKKYDSENTKDSAVNEDSQDRNEKNAAENTKDSAANEDSRAETKRNDSENTMGSAVNEDSQDPNKKRDDSEYTRDSVANEDSQDPTKKNNSENTKDSAVNEVEFKVPDKIIDSETSKKSTSQEASTSMEVLHVDVKTDVAGCLGSGNLSKMIIASSSTMQWLYSEPLMSEDDDDDKDYSIDDKDKDCIDDEEDFDMESSDTSVDQDDDDPITMDADIKEHAGGSKDSISVDDKQNNAEGEDNEDCVIVQENKDVFLPKVQNENKSPITYGDYDMEDEYEPREADAENIIVFSYDDELE